ncbi:MAG: translation initiation factor IF-3 [Candidatus Neomarinimicrobiota bacterium]|nr:translation initiation factor IF-3 [Candidatus Neomarinimicrobiota bacterium]
MADLTNIKINEFIKAEEVRLIDNEGQQLGVVSLEEAISSADNVGMDLVEVAPNSKPPVCKILDFGKMKYEEKKKEQQSKKKQHVIKIKEIRIRPRIGEHDLENKLNMGRKFLKEGFKLKVTMMFRGREMSRIDLGEDVLNKVSKFLSDVAVVEKQNPLEGKRIVMIFTGK